MIKLFKKVKNKIEVIVMKSFRSDFADELLDTIIENEDYILKKKSFKDVTLTHVKILKESKKLNKKAGNYLSVDFQNIYEATSRHHISDVLTKALSQIHKIKKNEKILIVGLGNNNIIADSLGPAVCDKIVVTNHLFKLFPEEIDKDTKKVCVFTPKVMGQTGLESSDLIKAICNLFNPSLVILIDSLASSSIQRINRVIQISDDGIAPGSGIGNIRKPINKEILNVPIIAIGVATVVDASQIVSEAFNKYFEKTKEKLKQKEKRQAVNEVLNNKQLSLVVTPKEIDEDIEHLSTIISSSLNKFIHDSEQTH